MNHILVLPRFFRKVHFHLVATYLNLAVQPVILGIFGRTGDGKSAQLVTALERCHVDLIRINAADLESGLAGEPGKLIARTYSAASLAVGKSMPTAIVVDDIDTTVGEWELNTGTVNHQQVLAELMHIADRPVDPKQNRPCAVPIFVTGNNLSLLYPPLRRHGRMSAFPWQPTRAELRDVVAHLLADLATASTLDQITDEFHEEPLAFFAEVRHAVMESLLLEELEGMTVDMRVLLHEHRRGDHLRAKGFPTRSDSIALDIARELYKKREASLKDFLRVSAKERA